MSRRFPTLALMQAYFGGGKLLAGSHARSWDQIPVPDLGALKSGDPFHMTWGELASIFSLGLLVVDLLHAFRQRDRALAQHSLSFLLFIGSLVLFISIPGYGNASFLIYLMIVFCQLTAGVLIMLADRRESHRPRLDGD